MFSMISCQRYSSLDLTVLPLTQNILHFQNIWSNPFFCGNFAVKSNFGGGLKIQLKI
jgi:hypothetical protein